MDPVAFTIGSRPIYWYGVLVATAFIATVAHWNILARKEGRPAGFGSDLGFWIMLSGILGARVAYVLANPALFFPDVLEIIRIDKGGLVFYGGFIGACIALAVFARRHKLGLWSMADFAITGVPLGHAIGRIGCFLNGCCYGSPTSLPWCVEAHDACRHPTQLYEAAFNLAVYGLLLWFYPRRRKDGTVFALYLIAYPLGRFLLEFLRGDERLHWLGFNMAQEISVVLVIAGAALWFGLKRNRTSGKVSG